MARRLVFLTRHGQTDWNVEGRWQGHTDIPLNDAGRAQARALAEALRVAGAPVLSGLVSSDLCRARETAQIVGESLGVAVSYVDADLRERMFGLFEGLTRAECELHHGELWRAWLEDQRAPDGIELPGAVATRMTRAIGRAVERLGRDGDALLLVTHGGALRAAVQAATGARPGPIANGAIWRLEWDGGIVSAEAMDPVAAV
jgi:broad specificity phosphatase PhoE